MIELKTGYEWCLLERIRPLDISQWSTTYSFKMESFYEEKITYMDFFERIKACDIKERSTPRKSEMFLNYRMYGMVPYNLSPIQQGIQFGHGVVEYGQLCNGIPPFNSIYDKWAMKDKTFIILNGGTTNENPDRLGTLQQISKTLRDNNVLVAEFREPDLNDTLTSVVFLVDERVFDRELYSDFIKDDSSTDEENNIQYKNWIEKIGGEKNLFLRNFLITFKLA